MRILVVEDEPYQRLLLAEELEEEGFEVRTVGSGREALRVFDAERPDLVIADLKLPDMDGTRVVHAMKQKAESVPVIVSTAYDAVEERALEGPWDLRVLKSSDLGPLKEAVRSLLPAERGRGA